MRNRLLGTALTLSLLLLQPPVHAEIFTWVDAQGRLNVGNLPPPDCARVTRVMPETEPHSNPYNDAAREAAQRAEVEALAQRVAQLQSELQFAARQPPQPPQVVVVQAPAPTPYAVEAPAPPVYAQDCVNGWSGCDAWWSPAFAPFATFVYLPPGRHTRPALHGGRNGHGDGSRGGRPMRRPPMKLTAFAHR